MVMLNNKLSEAEADTKYLRLNCSNDPLTEALELNKTLDLQTTSSATVGVINTGGAAFLHTFGTNNTFLGLNSGNFTMTGQDNLGFGANTLPLNIQGSNNVAIGANALASNLGTNAGEGTANLAVGTYALWTNTEGRRNIALGLSALVWNTTGNWNVAIGRHAGGAANGVVANACTTSTNCTWLGLQTGLGSPTQRDYAMALGSNATVTAANTCVIGRPTGTTGEVDLGLGVETTAFITEGNAGTAKLFVEQGALAAADSITVFRKQANQAGRDVRLYLLKSDIGEAAITSGDKIGTIWFGGHDGTDYNLSAAITGLSDGAVSANVVPMGILFRTSETNSAGLADRLWIDPDGTILLGTGTFTTISPSGHVLLPAGTATAGDAPIKFQAGTALGTPEAGAVEYHDDRFYLTNVACRKAIDRSSDVIIATTTVENTTTETTIYTSPIAANALKVGNYIKQLTMGTLTTASAADIVVGRVKVGGATIATITSGGTGTHTDQPWHFDVKFTVREVGATAEIAYHIDLELDGTTSVDGQTDIDTTAQADLTVTVEWNNAKAGNILDINQGITEYKN